MEARVEEQVRQTIEAVEKLYHGEPGSSDQQRANAYLMQVESSSNAVSIGCWLLKTWQAQQEKRGELVFVGCQLILSKVRHGWRSIPSPTKRELLEQVLQVYTQVSLQPQPGRVIQDRILLVIAAIVVRSVQEHEIVQRGIEAFVAPPFENSFAFLKVVVEELEISWMDLNTTDRSEMCRFALQMKSATLNLLYALVSELGRNPGNVQTNRIKESAIQCLQAWTACPILHQNEASVSENSDHGLVNVGIGLDQLMMKKEDKESSLLDWICFEFSSSDGDSSVFHACGGILVESLSLQTFEAIQIENSTIMNQYQRAIKQISSVLIDKFRTVKAWATSVLDTDEVDEEDPHVIAWRVFSLVAAALCSHHFKALLLLCDEETHLEILNALIFGVKVPLDPSTAEACFDFWDNAGDALYACFTYLQRNPNLKPKLPSLLTEEGSLELFNTLIDAFVHCTVLCLRVQQINRPSPHSLATSTPSGSSSHSESGRLFARVYDSILGLCRIWPELQPPSHHQLQQQQQDLTSHKAVPHVSERSTEKNIRRCLAVLHGKLLSALGERTTPESLLVVQAVVELFRAVLEASEEMEDFSSDDDDSEEDDDGEDGLGETQDEEERAGYADDEEDDEEDHEHAVATMPFHRGEDFTVEAAFSMFHHDSSPRSANVVSPSHSKSSGGGYSGPGGNGRFAGELGSVSSSRGSYRMRTSSLVAPRVDSEPSLALELSGFWCNVVSDLISGCWKVEELSLRRSLCTLCGYVMDWILAGPNLFSHEGSCSPSDVLRRMLGFLLSSLLIVRDDTCVVAAESLCRICRRVSRKKESLLSLRTAQIPFAMFDTEGRLLSFEMGPIVGVDGILGFIEKGEILRIFHEAGMAAGFVYEAITVTGLRLILHSNTSGGTMHTSEALSRSTEMLAGFLSRVLKHVSQVVLHVKSDVNLNARDARRLMVNQLLALSHVMKGLGATRGFKKLARRCVPSAVLPLVHRLWPDLQMICSELIVVHHYTDVLEALCDTLTQLISSLQSGVEPFAPKVISDMVTCFEATFDPACLHVLHDLIQNIDVDSVAQVAPSMLSKISWLVCRAVPRGEEGLDLLDLPFGVALNPELHNPELAKALFKFWRGVTRDMPFAFVQGQGQVGKDSEQFISTLHLALGAGAMCLVQLIGGSRAAGPICSFISFALAGKRAPQAFTAIVEECKPCLLQGCVDYLGSASRSPDHVRSNHVIDVVKGILSRPRGFRPDANSFQPKESLCRILSLPKYAALSEETRQAVCYYFLAAVHDKASLKARISDASLLLCGLMEPPPGFSTGGTPSPASSFSQEEHFVDI